MVDQETIHAMQRLIKQQEEIVARRVFDKWGVDFYRVGMFVTENAIVIDKTAKPHESITADTELIPGMLWGGYSERLNTLVLRTT